MMSQPTTAQQAPACPMQAVRSQRSLDNNAGSTRGGHTRGCERMTERWTCPGLYRAASPQRRLGATSRIACSIAAPSRRLRSGLHPCSGSGRLALSLKGCGQAGGALAGSVPLG